MASLTATVLSSSSLSLHHHRTHNRIRLFPRRRLQVISMKAVALGKEKGKGKSNDSGGGKVKYVGTQAREKHLEEMIEKTVMEAEEVCSGDEESEECKVAWDQVEEVSRAKAHFRRKIEDSPTDPLESYCSENPDTDECRIYED